MVTVSAFVQVKIEINVFRILSFDKKNTLRSRRAGFPLTIKSFNGAFWQETIAT